MQIGMIGLGRMGGNMTRRLIRAKHNCVVFDRNAGNVEALDILRGASAAHLQPGLSYSFNLADIAEVWRRGSVISSWLLDLTAAALASDGNLESYTGFVEDSGEGRWTIAAALEEGVSAEVLSAALYTRFRSRQKHTFAEKFFLRCANDSAGTWSNRQL